MLVLENNKDWVPVLWLGEPRYKTNNKIEILSYVNSVGSTPPITLEPITVIACTGESVHYIKPSYPHEQKMANNLPITVVLPNGVTMISTK